MSNVHDIINQIRTLFESNPELAIVINNGQVLHNNGTKFINNIFYVINRRDKNVGIFSYYFTTLSHVIYAMRKGWIPIVDMQNGHYIYYHEDESEANVVNVWDRYFNQPNGFNLREIESATNVIYAHSVWAYPAPGEIDFSRMVIGDKDFKEAIKYSRFLSTNQDTEQFSEDLINSLQIDLLDAIGVSYRSTYDELKPSQHFYQPSILEIFEKVDDLLSKELFSYIFLASEDDSAIQRFIERYGIQRVFYLERPRIGSLHLYEEKPSAVSDAKLYFHHDGMTFGRSNEKHKIALEYISEMIGLSKCGGLIGGRTNGTMYAYFRNGSVYKYIYLPIDRYP